MHWHAMHVISLAFSYNGHYVYSGGEEGVLVVWDEEDVGDRRCHWAVVGRHDTRKISDGVAVDGLAVTSCEDLRTGA